MDHDEIAPSSHSRPAFLLNLTEGGRPIQVTSLHRLETWSIRHQQSKVGDEIYLLKPARGVRNPEKDSRGIVGRGEIIRAPYSRGEALRFPLGWVTAQTVQWVVDVRIDELIDPSEKHILTLANLSLIHPPANLWHRQPNGMRIPENVAEAIRSSRQWKTSPIAPTVLEYQDIPETSATREVEVRKGQQQFREKLLQYWEVCSVTGCSFHEVLIASHIVPWAEASDSERLDVFNGLLLTPNLDRLFDNYFISFNSSGDILISKTISSKAMHDLGINPSMKLRRTDAKLLSYLQKHEKEFLEKEQAR